MDHLRVARDRQGDAAAAPRRLVGTLVDGRDPRGDRAHRVDARGPAGADPAVQGHPQPPGGESASWRLEGVHGDVGEVVALAATGRCAGTAGRPRPSGRGTSQLLRRPSAVRPSDRTSTKVPSGVLASQDGISSVRSKPGVHPRRGPAADVVPGAADPATAAGGRPARSEPRLLPRATAARGPGGAADAAAAPVAGRRSRMAAAPRRRPSDGVPRPRRRGGDGAEGEARGGTAECARVTHRIEVRTGVRPLFPNLPTGGRSGRLGDAGRCRASRGRAVETDLRARIGTRGRRPLALAGDTDTPAPRRTAALRHRDPAGPRLRPARGGQGRGLPVRPDGAVRAARRARPVGGQLRRAASLADPPGLRGDVHPQHHRHRRQDPGEVGRAGPALVQPRLRDAARARRRLRRPQRRCRRPTSRPPPGTSRR